MEIVCRNEYSVALLLPDLGHPIPNVFTLFEVDVSVQKCDIIGKFTLAAKRASCSQVSWGPIKALTLFFHKIAVW